LNLYIEIVVMGVKGSSVELFELSTEGVVLGIGLFVLTLAMMIGIWFIMKVISPEPFTFYTFPGRLYTFRIVSETSTRLVVTNTFSALLMWPLGSPTPTNHCSMINLYYYL
jgi:hypothetical protein